MGRKWVWERRRDYYYRRAKCNGYRSRASYKLIQINNRFRIIRKGYCVLDMGCSPGGWSQVAIKVVGPEGYVIGIDKEPMKPFETDNFCFIKGDIRDEETMAHVSRVLEDIGYGCFDTIISDMSPNITGNYTMDQARSVELAEWALEYASKFLCFHGNMVVKVFQGVDFPRLLNRIKRHFDYVKVHSPKASRKHSSEVYIIAKAFNATN